LLLRRRADEFSESVVSTGSNPSSNERASRVPQTVLLHATRLQNSDALAGKPSGLTIRDG
jgi:hypothetical protein